MIGMSYMIDLAKIAAAKMAYESLSQHKLAKEQFRIISDAEIKERSGHESEVSNKLTETVHHIDIQASSIADKSEILDEEEIEKLFAGDNLEANVDTILKQAGINGLLENDSDILEFIQKASENLNSDSAESECEEVEEGD